MPYSTSVTLQKKLDGVRNLKSIKCLSGYIDKLRKKKTLSEDAKRSMQEIPLPVDLKKSRQETPLIEDGNIKAGQEKPLSKDHGNSNKRRPPTDDEALNFGTQLLAELFVYSMSATIMSYAHNQSLKTKKEKEKQRLENEHRKDNQIAILRKELTTFKEETRDVIFQMDNILFQQVNNSKELISKVDQNRKAIQHLIPKGKEYFQNSVNIYKE